MGSKVEVCSSASAQLLAGLLEELEEGNLRVEGVEEVEVEEVQQVQKKGWTGRDLGETSRRWKQEVLLERGRPATHDSMIIDEGTPADRHQGDGLGDVGSTHSVGLLQSSLKLHQLLLGLLVFAALALQLVLHLVEHGHHVVLLLVLGLALPVFLLKALLQVLMICTE